MKKIRKYIAKEFIPTNKQLDYRERLIDAEAKADVEPVRLDFLGYVGDLWLFRENCYLCGEFIRLSYTDDEIKLLIINEYDKERKQFESLKRKFKSSEIAEESFHRIRIPEQVRIEVWHRDVGKCARCGSRENLEYDHIIPVSKGGSNTTRNIELLCEKCNRSKGTKIE